MKQIDEVVDHWGIPLSESAPKAKAKPKSAKPKQSLPSVNIPKGYQKFVDGSGNLANVENWKVQVQLGNSVGRGEPDVGGWGNIGYVFINPATKEVIPIARSDEHHAGWDLMRTLEKKKIIKDIDDWGYIYIYGTHVYESEDKEFYKKVYQTWLDLGGKDIKVEIYSDGSGGKERFTGTLTDFVAAKSFIPVKGEIAKPGQRLIKALEQYAVLVKQALKNPTKEAAANKAAEAVLAAIEPYHLGLGTVVDAAEKAMATGDFQKIQEAILGFEGIKNEIHQGLRAMTTGGRHIWDREYETFFGDVAAALKMFDALGGI